MTRITIDAEMRKKLLNLTKPLELCDESGSVLGKLIPTPPNTDADDWIELGPSLSDEEAERIMDGREDTVAHEDLINRIKQL